MAKRCSQALWWLGGAVAAGWACSPAQIGDQQAEDQSGNVAVQEQAALKHEIAPHKELFVTDLSVVADARFTEYREGKAGNDPEGGWSFGRLIENLMAAENITPPAQRSQFILNWLKLWEPEQTINGLNVPARPAIRNLLIDPWKRASGCQGSDADCQLDMKRAPFRLDAIVYRPDLRKVPAAGERGKGGEGRFIFTAKAADGGVLPFTIIFEYNLPIADMKDILKRAQDYHKLGALPFGPDFNEKLFNLTRAFSGRNVASGRPNGSALSQIRTNEVALNPVWEMREFVLSSDGQRLLQDTVKNEPAAIHNGSQLLTAYATRYETEIISGSINMPPRFQDSAWLAGSAMVPRGLRWEVPGASEAVRKSIALNTCSGCHLSETATPFLHVMGPDVRAFLRQEAPPTQRGEAIVSKFLAAELTGPRTWDLQDLLSTDEKKIKDGPGRDHK